jgi:transcriptional regulator with XRE-family HTH domain
MSRRFNQARLQSGLTLAELEKKSGCAMSMLSGIASGDRMPRVDSIARIARALGVSPGWLAYGDGPSPDWLTETEPRTD